MKHLLEFAEKNTKLFYFLLFVILAGVTCFLQPHDDDWQYLYYFDNPEAWGFQTHKYVHDCILFPGSYWRPLWSMFNRAEAIWAPMSMPYANHIFITFGMVGIAYIMTKLMEKFGVAKKVAIAASVVLILATTSMGAMLSVDSFQNVYAAFFGTMSALLYVNNKGWKRWTLWFITGWLAAMGKETGFVWFLAGPVLDEVLMQKCAGLSFHFSKVNYKKFIPKALIACIPIVLYLGIYISLKPDMLNRVGVSSDGNVQTEIVDKSQSKDMFTTMTEMEKHNSYKLTPTTFVKNIGVLYVFGLVPVDTSAVYFKNYALLGITTLLALVWVILMFDPVRRYLKEHGQEAIVLLLLAFWISGPSMVTRAGEISPIIHMAVVALVMALLFNEIRWTKTVKVGLVCFFVATAITDIHKYCIAYKAGAITREIAQKVVSETEGKPEKVLMVQVNDFENKKSGAFMINPADGIRQGSAMLREYGYEYPKELKYVSIPDDENIQVNLDSLVNEAKGVYDCVWFCHDLESKVYNLK